jgi:RimJ/RimL family protein N-acetyltransferase
MNFARATLSDARLLFDWRNDPVTRAQSHQSGELIWSDHMSWFEQSLARSDREIYFASLDNCVVGTVRRDERNGYSLLSWTISPSERGKGFGAKMLSEFVNQFPQPYRAEIKNDNAGSIKMARTAGFNLEKTEGDFQVWKFNCD